MINNLIAKVAYPVMIVKKNDAVYAITLANSPLARFSRNNIATETAFRAGPALITTEAVSPKLFWTPHRLSALRTFERHPGSQSHSYYFMFYL
jgi:hypothetical protein